MSTQGEWSGTARSDLVSLTEALLRYYSVTQPPVPVEQMLKTPPAGLDGVDPNQVSFIMEHGLYHFAPRLAMARLLYRAIAHCAAATGALGVEISPAVSYADIKFFSRCLLMPERWVRRLVEQGLSVEQISTYLQAPPDAVVTRLAELGLPVPGTG